MSPRNKTRLFSFDSFYSAVPIILFTIFILLLVYYYFQHKSLENYFVVKFKTSQFSVEFEPLPMGDVSEDASLTAETQPIEIDLRAGFTITDTYNSIPRKFVQSNGAINECFYGDLEIKRSAGLNYFFEAGNLKLNLTTGKKFSHFGSTDKTAEAVGTLISNNVNRILAADNNLIIYDVIIEFNPKCKGNFWNRFGLGDQPTPKGSIFSFEGVSNFGETRKENAAHYADLKTFKSGEVQIYGRTLQMLPNFILRWFYMTTEQNKEELFDASGTEIAVPLGSEVAAEGINASGGPPIWLGEALVQDGYFEIAAAVSAAELKVTQPQIDSPSSMYITVNFGHRLLYDPTLQIFLSIVATVTSLGAIMAFVLARLQTQSNHVEQQEQLRDISLGNISTIKYLSSLKRPSKSRSKIMPRRRKK